MSSPNPKAGSDAHGGEGEILGEIQVQVRPGTAGALAVGKPTGCLPLGPEMPYQCEG